MSLSELGVDRGGTRYERAVAAVVCFSERHLVAVDLHLAGEDRGRGQRLAREDVPPDRKRRAEPEARAPRIRDPRNERRAPGTRPSTSSTNRACGRRERGVGVEDEEHVAVEAVAPLRGGVAVLARRVDLGDERSRPRLRCRIGESRSRRLEGKEARIQDAVRVVAAPSARTALSHRAPKCSFHSSGVKLTQPDEIALRAEHDHHPADVRPAALSCRSRIAAGRREGGRSRRGCLPCGDHEVLRARRRRPWPATSSTCPPTWIPGGVSASTCSMQSARGLPREDALDPRDA